MRRAQIVTDEMREISAFNESALAINTARQKGSLLAAKRRIKNLMNTLIDVPSEQTLGYFVEMQRRWGYLVDAFSFLESHWTRWATFDDRLELIRWKFQSYSSIERLITNVAAVASAVDCHRRTLLTNHRLHQLIHLILDQCETNVLLRKELLDLLDWRYQRVASVSAYVSNLHRRRYATLEHRYGKHV